MRRSSIMVTCGIMLGIDMNAIVGGLDMLDFDLDLLCNTFNAESGRFKYSDPHLSTVLLKAQSVINQLRNEGETGINMSNMIECDACKERFYADSRSEKGAFHEVWIDHTSGYHLCNDCYVRMMETIFRRVWSDGEQQFVRKG